MVIRLRKRRRGTVLHDSCASASRRFDLVLKASVRLPCCWALLSEDYVPLAIAADMGPLIQAFVCEPLSGCC